MSERAFLPHRPPRGRVQCTCDACGRQKGDHDRNAGWWELRERGRFSTERHFCPDCSPANWPQSTLRDDGVRG
jgi:hypothetical protein